MGTMKEQSSNHYAQKQIKQRFLTVPLYLPFWGDSEGEPRNAVSGEVYRQAFSAIGDSSQ